MSRQYNRFLERSATAVIVAFLDEIRLPVRFCGISEATLLPGIRIERSELVVDETRLLYPGGLLHEEVTLRFYIQNGAPALGRGGR